MSFFEQDPSQNISMTQQFESMTEFLGSDFLPEMTEDMNEQFDSTSEFLMEVDACKMIGEEEKEPENKTNFFNELHLLENNGQKMEESGGVTDSLDQAFSPDVSVYKPQEVEIQTDLSNGIVPFELTGEERHHCSERAEKDVELHFEHILKQRHNKKNKIPFGRLVWVKWGGTNHDLCVTLNGAKEMIEEKYEKYATQLQKKKERDWHKSSKGKAAKASKASGKCKEMLMAKDPERTE